MKKFTILQWGKNRSIVMLAYNDTKETEILLIDNDYLMTLDEMGMVV